MKNLLYLLLVTFFFSCSKNKEQESERPTDQPGERPTEVEYRVTNTNASVMYISYHNEDQRLCGFQDPANWSTKIVLKQKPFPALLRGDVIAKDNTTATLTLEIRVNGTVVKSETQSGKNPSIKLEYTVN